ncbi:hypothetical protein CSB07_00825 [Candidatus Gracilibacteria bacterium]|nr:MAG: hypothetical protein CSB07_00825 [Candidatus Gracilibacteria bacterium]PIE85007.1 MAG: hypothetical protein CSA08_04145 [Candidatus Gracilibacteria bacterium]
MAGNKELEKSFRKSEISPDSIARISPGNIHPEFRDSLASQLDCYLEDLENQEVIDAILRWNEKYKEIIVSGSKRPAIIEVSSMPATSNDDNYDKKLVA